MTVVSLTEDRFDDFLQLIHALAAYERLAPPDAAAAARLGADALGPRAPLGGPSYIDGDEAVAAARPTLDRLSDDTTETIHLARLDGTPATARRPPDQRPALCLCG